MYLEKIHGFLQFLQIYLDGKELVFNIVSLCICQGMSIVKPMPE